MKKVSIDGKEYEVDSLSKEAIEHIQSIQFVDGELARLNAQAAALQTAKNSYAKVLIEMLNPDSENDKKGADEADIPKDIVFD